MVALSAKKAKKIHLLSLAQRYINLLKLGEFG